MYDLIVIGGGPGGYSGALEAVKYGKKVLLIEKESLGGVCLNHGCIPTKSLLNSAKLYKKSSKIEHLGIEISGIKYNFDRANHWKESVVSTLRDNLTSLLIQKKIEVVTGVAILEKSGSVCVGNDIYIGKKILLATGSSPSIPPIEGIDNPFVLTSREILQLDKRPETLTIIGGGVIGVEFASYFSSIGTEVTIIEMDKRILPNMDKRTAKILEKSLNVTYHFNATVSKIDNNCLTFIEGDKSFTISSDVILLATGRVPNIKEFKELGIVENRAVKVNNKMETDIPGIYAVGDVTGLSLLAHSATYMAEIAVKNMYGEDIDIDLSVIPSVVYSDPELAGVGLGQDQAKKKGLKIIKNNFRLNQNGRYLAEDGKDDGLCSIIVDKDSMKIIGVHLVGTGVSEVLSSGIIAVKKGLTIDEFKAIVFPHPSLSEVVKDTLSFIN